MGIDARILIRGVRRSSVTDEWLKRVSWDLVSAFDPKKFWIGDGLPPEEYLVKETAWYQAFEAHPLAERYNAAVGADERQDAHEKILADIGPPPTVLRLAVQRTHEPYRDDESPPGSVYHQDGDTVHAEKDECLLEVSLWGRYYGVGYERGDIRFYVGVAEWLEQNISGCTVWYGGDSSGCEAELFDRAARDRLIRHKNSSKGSDYFRRPWFGAGDGTSTPPPCGMCPGGVYSGDRYGAGANYAAYSCPGCGKTAETHDGGVTWKNTKENT